jgi:hypothetical protein
MKTLWSLIFFQAKRTEYWSDIHAKLQLVTDVFLGAKVAEYLR